MITQFSLDRKLYYFCCCYNMQIFSFIKIPLIYFHCLQNYPPSHHSRKALEPCPMAPSGWGCIHCAPLWKDNVGVVGRGTSCGRQHFPRECCLGEKLIWTDMKKTFHLAWACWGTWLVAPKRTSSYQPCLLMVWDPSTYTDNQVRIFILSSYLL